jgi:hypothetical protein
MNSEIYKNWLRTLSAKDLRTEEQNLKFIIREMISTEARQIAEAKLRKLKYIKSQT